MSPQTTVLPHRATRPAAGPARPALAPPPLAAPVRPYPALPGQAARGQVGHSQIGHPRAAVVAGRPVASPPPSRGVWIDRTSWLATADGRSLDLTYLEFEVLDFFVHNPGTAHSRQALLSSVWGHRADDASAPDLRTVDVLVTRLRRKLGPDHRYRIETIRRVGYRYRPLEDDSAA